MLSRRVYKYVVVGLLLNMMGVLTGLFSHGQENTDLGVVSDQAHLPFVLSAAVLYLLLLWNLFSSPRRYLQAFANQWALLPLLAFCALSATWSGEPSLVLRRVLILAATAVVGLMIGTDFNVLEIGQMLAFSSVLHLALCGAFFVFARGFLFSADDGVSFKGLTTHKNVFGFEQALAVIVFALCPLTRLRILRWPLTLLGIGMLVWSHSSGSFIATAAALVLMPFLLVSKLTPRQRMPLAMVVAITFVGLVLWIVTNIERIPALFSKDTTLTGRTELWSLVLIAINHRPWLGYGFDSFWRGLNGDSLDVIRGVGWLVPTAHNGYLDLLLSVGIVGAVLLAVIIAQFLVRALDMTIAGHGSSRLFPIVFLAMLLTYNLNESALLTRSGLPFFLITALSAAMAKKAVSTLHDLQLDNRRVERSLVYSAL